MKIAIVIVLGIVVLAAIAAATWVYTANRVIQSSELSLPQMGLPGGIA